MHHFVRTSIPCTMKLGLINIWWSEAGEDFQTESYWFLLTEYIRNWIQGYLIDHKLCVFRAVGLVHLVRVLTNWCLKWSTSGIPGIIRVKVQQWGVIKEKRCITFKVSIIFSTVTEHRQSALLNVKNWMWASGIGSSHQDYTVIWQDCHCW